MATVIGRLSHVVTYPTWAEVSLRALRHNFRTLREHVGQGVEVCAVVKADAYGHGIVACSRALVGEGARWLGVTSLDEGIALREAGISCRILLMTGLWRGEEDEIVRLGLTPSIWERWQVECLDQASRKHGASRYPVHLKVDSGMGRLGVSVSDLPLIIPVLKSARNLLVEGLSTHLASSDVLDSTSVKEQLARFEDARERLRSEGVQPAVIHVANTSAIIAGRPTWNNMVRPGLGLYGYCLPFRTMGGDAAGRDLHLNLKPVLTWKTRILTVRDFTAGHALGYGGTYVTPSAARIAVLPVGYSDGLNRALSSRGRVLVRGRFAAIVGLISMNLTLVDVTGISGVEIGDEVILLGSGSGLTVSAQEHADLAKTISYEILCAISKQIPRKYTDD